MRLRPIGKAAAPMPARPRRARRPVLEEVEARILYSADFTPGLLDERDALQSSEQRLLDSSGEFASSADAATADAQTPADASADTTPGASTQADSSEPAAPSKAASWELDALLAEDADFDAGSGAQAETDTAVAGTVAASAEVELAVAATPLAFERNAGQTDAQVDFLARGSGYVVWLADGDAVIALDGGDTGHVLRLDVLGGNPDAAASGEGLLDGTSNYFVGGQDQWRVDVANYTAVFYDEIYEGIDLRYYGNQRQLEYDFVLEAGARVSDIRLRFDGSQSVSIDAGGELVLDLGEGRSVAFKAPVSWQEGPSGREAVASRYVIHEDGSVGFEVGAYDPTRALTIDPVFAFGTYIGGNNGDQVLGMAADAAGNIYVTGYTLSANFPTTAGAYRTSAPGNEDIFVTKLTPDLGGFVYSTYLGGSNDEEGYNITVDAAGNAYVTGFTKSTDFPTLNAYQSTLRGGWDAFLTKLNASGNGLVYSTYLGGDGGGDTGYWVVVDAAGSAYVAGYATGSNFPTTAGAFDTTYANGEGFVTKFAPAGNTLVYSTFLGGSGFDAAYSLALEASGAVVVVGETASTNFQVTASAYQTTNDGNVDAFVTRLDATGSAITYSTYLGDSGADQAFAVALDSTNRAYVAGFAGSANFDVTAGAMDTTKAGGGDAFLAIVDPSQSGAASLDYATYIGGSQDAELAWNVTVDSAGRAYVAGTTDSNNFPTTAGAYRTSNAGSDDVFVMQINPVGGGASDLLYGTYWGGNNSDSALTGVLSNGKFYFAGGTASNSGIATAGTVDTSYGGSTDGFVAAFTFYAQPVVTANATPLAYTENAGAQLLDPTFTVSDSDSALLIGATLQFSANYVFGEDALFFDNANSWGITGTWSAASGTLTLTGASSVANYQLALRSITYTNSSQMPSTATRSIRVTVSDAETTSAPVVRQINVTSVNDVPAISAPASQTMAEDGTLVFSTGNGNAIGVSDQDAGSNAVQLTLTAASGVMSLFQTTGLTFATGDGVSDASMSFTGTIASISAALNGMSFTPDADFNGGASVQIDMSDLGHTGTPGPQIASRTVAITVDAVNDAPGVSVIADQSIPQGSSVGPLSFTVSDLETPAGSLSVTASSSNAALLPNANITLGGSGANRTISLAPLASQYGSATVTVSVFDGTDTTQLTFDLTVVPPNLPPVVSPTTLSVSENAANGTAVGNAGAFDPDPAQSFTKIYWTDYFDDQIRRSNLDGSGAQTLVSGLGDPVAIAVDYAHGKLYWTDTANNRIQRSNLDGSSVQTIVGTGLSTPIGIKVDSSGGKIYWVDAGTDKIQRANLDGTSIEDLLTAADGLSAPLALDLDLTNGKLYWVDDGTNSVLRADLDGNNAQTLVTGVGNPVGIVLDVAGNKMYWADKANSRIGRANLDGSGVTAAFISTSNGINGLAIDTARSKLYWTEDDNDRIRRANLDGSGVTTVYDTGLLSDPSGIALGAAVPGLTYSIVGGNTGGAFAIDAQTGAITVANGSVLDLESTPSYTLIVQAQDAGGMASSGTVTVNLLNVNEAPTALSLSNASLAEHTDTSAGFAVGTLTATDADAGDTHSYAVVGGADAANFSIAGSTLRIADGVLDFETKPSYQVTVRATDAGGLSVDRTFTISVTDLNDAPTVSAIPDQTIAEDSATGVLAFTVGDAESAAGTLVVTATSSDQLRIPDAGLVLGGSGASRTIQVTPAANAYGGPVTITVSVFDGSLTTLETFDVAITAVADNTLVVTTAADVSDGDISSIDALLMNRGADGLISLREAILAANNSPNAGSPDRIHFNIAGAGPHTINVSSALPAISDAVILDATTQPGFTGAPLIQLNGAGAGAGVHGLRLTGGASTVRGLVINRFDGAGMRVTSAGNTIAGNYIGLDLSGGADLGNKQHGLWITSSGNTIGGTNAGDRNVVSGNDVDGIVIDGGSGNVVLGNYVGTNAFGTGAVGNSEDGIWLNNASNNVIGGATPAARNVLSGNQWSGVGVTGSGSGNVIRGNYIGADASGGAALSNLQDGISIYGSDGAQIGGAGGAENVIAFNARHGVMIGFGTGHSVLENAIYANTGLGIDLGNDGVTANDADDADLGTNLGMNFPLLYSAVVSAGTVTVTGEARPGATVRFFEAAADASGYGEGQTFLGAGTVSGATPGAVDGTARRFSFSFAAGALNVGDRVTATATDGFGNTSEFSLALTASAVAPAIIVTPAGGLTTTEDGGSASFSVVLATAPSANVSIGVSSSDATEGSVSTGLLTFTSGNWSTAQTVTVTGVGDALPDGSIAYSVILAAATSADPAYAGIDPPDVSLTNLEGTNVAPVNALPGAQVVDEDAPLAVAGLSAADSNGNLLAVQLGAANGTLSVSLAGGATVSAGANGSGSLTLAGTQAQLNAALATLVYQGNANFAGADTLSIVSVDSGGLTDSDAIAITVDPVNDPAAVTMTAAPLAYAENDPATAIDPGLTLTDVDSPLLDHAHVTLTGNYAAGEDLLEYVYNPLLPAITATWDPGSGELTLWGAASAADYQAALRSVTYRNLSDAPSTLPRTITIEVEDGISVDAGSFASRPIGVAAVNDAPVITSDGGGATASRSVVENSTFVSDVDAADIDLPAQTLAYSIAGGADAGRFTIDALTGVLSFLSAPDREAPSDANLDGIYEVTVGVSDGNGGGDQQALTVSVLDADEFDVAAPADANAAANSVAEDAAAGTAVGITAFAADADATTNTITYSLDDDAGGLFAIDAGSGVVRVAGALDAEAAVSHGIVVRALSADGSFATQAFTIAVTDVNDWPVGPVTDVDVAPELVDENLAPGAAVGYTAFAVDPDLTSNTVSYSLLDDAGGRFAIDAVSGVVTTAGALDFEAAASHTIIVRAASIDGSSGTALVTIAVGDVNEAPAASNQTFTVPENSSPGTPVGSLTATDPDAGDVLSYAIVAGDPSGAFAIDAAGLITVANSAALDFETTPVFTLDVLVTDAGGLTASATVTVNLSDANDPPIAVDDAAATGEDAPVNVNPAAGVLANDSDLEGGTLTVTAVEGSAADVGNTIVLASGALLRLNANGSFDYDPNGAFDWLAAGDTGFDFFTYEVSDPGGESAIATVTITLAGLNDAPAGYDTTVTATEDVSYVFSDVDFGFADPDSNLQALTIVTLPGQGSLTLSGTPVSAGTVVSAAQLSSGALRFNAAANQNGTAYASFDVRVSDGLASAAAASRVTIDVAAVNDLPWVGPSTTPGTEDTALTFTAAHFTSMFSDIDGDTLAQVRIVSLPGNGSLTLGGTPVAAGADIPVAQLANLAFVPNADWNGTTSFDWRGHDGAGLSVGFATMTLALAAVNDAPVLTAGAAGGSVLWGDTLTFSSTLLQVSDVDNAPGQLVYTVASAPGSGTLYRSGVALGAGGTFTQDDIDMGRVSYVNAGGLSGADGFTFTVADGAGGTLAATSFDIAVGAPPPPPPVVTPPPPPPPPPSGGGTTPTGGSGGGSTGTGTEPGAEEPAPPGAVPVSQGLEAALLDGPAPQLNDAAGLTRNSVDVRGQRVQIAQVAFDGSYSAYTVYTNAIAPTTAFGGEAADPLAVGGTLLSAPSVARADLAAAVESVSRQLSDAEFVDALDTMREQIDGKIEVQGQLMASSVAVTGGLSVGYVIWLLRGGLLLTSLLSSLPAWHAVDPMPVLARGGGNDDDEGADEDPLERLFGKAKDRLLGGWFRKGAPPAPEPADPPHPHESDAAAAAARQEATA
jgi:VCBS repeat-containing protein